MVSGSHKANFPCPPEVRSLEVAEDYTMSRLYRHVDAKAGDVIIFS